LSKKLSLILIYYSDAENTPVVEETPGKCMTDEQYRCSMEDNANTSSQRLNDKLRSDKEKEDKIKKLMQGKGKPN